MKRHDGGSINAARTAKRAAARADRYCAHWGAALNAERSSGFPTSARSGIIETQTLNEIDPAHPLDQTYQPAIPNPLH
jgi:hypothetical protein